MVGVMAVTSWLVSWRLLRLFLANNRLYDGLQIKAIVSHTCLKGRKQLPVEIHETNSLTPRIN